MKFLRILRRILIFILLAFLTPILLSKSVVDLTSPVEKVRQFTRFSEFEYLDWTLDAFIQKFQFSALNLSAYLTPQSEKVIVLTTFDKIREIQILEAQINQIFTDPEISNPDVVAKEYFELLDQANQELSQLQPLAENILQRQLTEVLKQQNFGFLGELFPPVLYQLTPLPKALIVSPRDTIRQDANLSLETDFNLEEWLSLETEIEESLNVSALVTNIGGVGTYPTMVMQSSNFTWVAGVVAHEWTHNFLTLRPLGLSYGVTPELRTINETTASIAEEELKWALIERYYPEFLPEPVETTPAEEMEDEIETNPFNFDLEMYLTRTHVDELLAAGQIEEAESYMEERRLFFYDNGYRIRKLNQAYFAFHSAYVNAPSDGSEGQTGASGSDPVGPLVWKLRENSSSLANFLNRISWITSLEKLQQAVQ